ncbi:MAG: FAD binding domain-containing protein [Rhodobacteraceae bacterium]|jgi:CO/xanthine dehydrogenase FAD-binding subunit|nr:FAD binding domain-containing protein [Paracoccaceae bacterium]
MSGYVRPASLTEALGLLARGPHVLLAGGTDLYPATEGPRLDGAVIDLSGLPELAGIAAGPRGGLVIGACTSWAAIAAAGLPAACDGLRAAAAVVGGRQIQNAGTIGGNLCNASPAADGVPPLLTLAAEVVLAGPRGSRRLPLEAFLAGPRLTRRAPDEILTAVHLPAAALAGRGVFLKLGARAHLVISIVMVAARLAFAGGRVAAAALAVGACSPVARRLPAVEAALVGALPEEAAGRVDRAAVTAALAPLDDVRASAAYRAEAAGELVARAVAGLARAEAGR